MLRRCEHGVYQPADVEGPNQFCSGCRPATHMIKLHHHGEKDGDEIKTTSCPVCSSKEFEYLNEDSYSCPQCGFCTGDIL